MRKILFLLFSLFSLAASAQNKDSLVQQLTKVKTEEERINLIYLILDDSGDQIASKGLYYHKTILDIAHKNKYKATEAVVTAELGYAIVMNGDLPTGTEMCFKALRLAEDAGSQRAIGIAYDNLYVCFDNDKKKGMDYLQKALTASTKAGDWLFMTYELGNLSSIYLVNGKLDSAMIYNQRATEIAVSKKVDKLIPYQYVAAGYIQISLGNKALALEYYRLALAHPFTEKDIKTQIAVYRGFAGFYYAQNNKDSALFYAYKMYNSSTNGFYSLRETPAALIWHLYEGKNSDSALKYVKIFYRVRDSVAGAGKTAKIRVMSILEDERQEKAKAERNQNIQLIAITLGVIGLLIFFFLLSHSVMANQKLIRFLGVIALLIVFEFINLLLHPYLADVTHHSQVWMLLIMVCIAALLIPLHHKLEHWIIHRFTEKNNKIRLAAARKTIEKLEGPGK